MLESWFMVKVMDGSDITIDEGESPDSERDKQLDIASGNFGRLARQAMRIHGLLSLQHQFCKGVNLNLYQVGPPGDDDASEEWLRHSF